MNTLDEIKAIIDLWGEKCDCGIFDCHSHAFSDRLNVYIHDQLRNVYMTNDCSVDICENHKYIDVVGLSKNDFKKLEDYYNRNYSCLKDYYVD